MTDGVTCYGACQTSGSCPSSSCCKLPGASWSHPPDSGLPSSRRLSSAPPAHGPWTGNDRTVGTSTLCLNLDKITKTYIFLHGMNLNHSSEYCYSDPWWRLVCVYVPVKQLSVFLLEFGLQVIVGQTVTFQFCHLLLQITDLRKMSKFLIHFLNSSFFFTFTSDIGPQTFFPSSNKKKLQLQMSAIFPM